MASIKYEIVFLKKKWQDLYGDIEGEITGTNLKDPYSEVRKKLGNWIADQKKDTGTINGGAVPKFRFVSLQVNGETVADLGKRVVWCLHCEQVAPARRTPGGGDTCLVCGAAGYDLWDWSGPYKLGRVYRQYSSAHMRGIGAD